MGKIIRATVILGAVISMAGLLWMRGRRGDSNG